MDSPVDPSANAQMQIELDYIPFSDIDDKDLSGLHHELSTSQPEGPSFTSLIDAQPARTFTPDQLHEQAQARMMRQAARQARRPARTRAATRISSRGGIEKSTARDRKGKVADWKLSVELDRLLVGDDTAAGSAPQSRVLNCIQHPLRAVLHGIPGLTYDTELDSVSFRKHRRVLFGIEKLTEEGGRDAAKEWLEGFLLLAFETMGKVMETHPMCKYLDDVPNMFVTVAREMERAIFKLPYSPALRARRAMERRLCLSHDLRKLTEWTLEARRRFLESGPKVMPGFGVFGRITAQKGTELEEQLWAAIDTRNTGSSNMRLD
ncbi:hypothetical protein CTA2_7441 [Colletotrichum tanaceti]|uniref:Uncharacterized protein n=1 Tax=Colletotrichum tanaceti TaxID=1306861 RepID=A0A4U6XR20_9PEZI|nr:hypothetical protein CTA2_7441 [Colletotrichum tanaceti]TKW58333.1 hypothetical protein CTA1_5216 [Colletotrichum tanaceti]